MRLTTLVLVVSFTAANPAAAQDAAGEPLAFAYCFDLSGTFVRVDLPQGRVSAMWALPLVDGLGRVLPAYAPKYGHSALGVWQPGASRVNGPWLYGVFPAQNAEDEQGPYQILLLGLPDFKLMGRIELPPGSDQPTILLSPDGGQLYVSYTPDVSKDVTPVVRAIDVYDAIRLERIRTSRGADNIDVRVPSPGAYFGEGAYFSKDGTAIFDEMSKVRPSGDQMMLEHILWTRFLTAAQWAQIDPLIEVNPVVQKPWLPFTFLSSRDGIALVALYRKTSSVTVSVDLENSKVLAVMEVPAARATVLAGAKTALFEEIQFRRQGAAQSRAWKTGKFFVMDIQRGIRLTEFSVPALAGYEEEHRVLAVAGDGSSLAYQSGEDLYLLSPRSGWKHTLIRSHFGASQVTKCVFSER